MLILAIIALLGSAAGFRRDYQDTWILEGLEIPFLLFVMMYAIAFFSERNTSWMVALAVLVRSVFLLIPNLKYIWFQGVYSDQHGQYALATYVHNEGHISAPLTSVYTSTPLFHLLISIFSSVLGIEVVDSMKYLPVLFSSIYPLLTFIIVKKMGFPEGGGILKYALFISSVPFSFEQYVVTGGLFGVLLVFIILFSLIAILQKKDRRYWLVCIILTFALAAAHSVTSTILTVLLLAIMGLKKVSYFRPRLHLRTLVTLMVALISVAWLMFAAHRALEAISRSIFLAVSSGRTPPSESLPPTFFELARVDIFAAARTFLVFYGADLFLLFLTFIGLIILLKKRKTSNDVTNFLLVFGVSAFLVMLVGVLLKLGATRTLGFERLLFPILCGITVLYIPSKKSWIRPIVFSLIIILAIPELYACQPLIPSANILYKDLDPSVPIGYVNQVNSIYQRQVVNFAGEHIVGRITSDSITRNQMLSLLGVDFLENHLVNYYPLDTRRPKLKYDFFIIHIPGKSGILEEQAKFRTPSLILGAVCNSSIVYTNGESYIITESSHLS
jgi:hypothetical protein